MIAMIAPPLRPSLLRFELTRRVRSRALLLGLGLFVLAQATVRVLTHLGHFNGSGGEFRSLYFLALIPAYGFGLLEDRVASFDEALTANGVPPFQYVSAKLTAAALILGSVRVWWMVAALAASAILVGLLLPEPVPRDMLNGHRTMVRSAGSSSR